MTVRYVALGTDGNEYPLSLEDKLSTYNPSHVVMSAEIANYGRDKHSALNVLYRLVRCMHIMSIQVAFRYY